MLPTSGTTTFKAGWNSVEDLLQYTQEVSLRVDSTTEVVVDASLAGRIGFDEGRAVVRVAGVRLDESDPALPVCDVEIHFDALFNGIVEDIPTATVPIAELIEARYRVSIETIRQEISACELPAESAARLDADAGTPALRIRRWYHDADRRMFQTTCSLYPAERFTYVMDLGRGTG